MSGARTFPTKQHVVPQFLLRHFATGKKAQLHALDKHTGKVFAGAVRDLAAERDFYNVPPSVLETIWAEAAAAGESPPDPRPAGVSFEPWLSKLETRAAEVVARIVRQASLAEVGPDDRALVGYFAAVQFVRGPGHRGMIADLERATREALGPVVAACGEDPEAGLRRLGLRERTPDEHVREHLTHLMAAHEYAPAFTDKAWVLYRTPPGHALYIGDNPVTLFRHALTDEERLTGVGLTTPGVEIALPLSGQLNLSMIDPDLVVEARAGVGKAHRLARVGVALFNPAPLRALVDAVDGGGPVTLAPDNVVHLNSRQVTNASRFVYAADSAFLLARRMLEENPELRERPRVVVG